jgi:hypothetical protein
LGNGTMQGWRFWGSVEIGWLGPARGALYVYPQCACGS